MQLHVQTQDGRMISLQVEPNSSVMRVKEQLREHGISSTRLLLDAEPLQDAQTLVECKVSAEAVLECESIPNDVLDVQLLLFLPKDRALFVRARLEQLQRLDTQAENLLQELVPQEDLDWQSRLRRLPHLQEAKCNAREYAALEKVLYNLSIIKAPIDLRLLQYSCEVITQFMVTKEAGPRQDILFLMISIILRNAIACGLSLSPESGPVYDQIRSVLNGNEPSHLLVAKEVFQALQAVSVLLRCPARETRLGARSICEVFRIPLQLPQMLALSIDGVKPEEKKEVNGLVLVIGTTGAGKSTLINCLSGIEYELCEDMKFGSMFLQPKEGQPVPPAKVGHDITSQTLYPQIIPAKDGSFYFCDCPGFDDNRRGDEAICAALGVPLAVRYARKISAIILTVSYSLTDVGAGRNGPLRLLNQTLAGIIKMPEQFHNFPLFFAITRPPEKGGPFRTSVLRSQMANRIGKFFDEATQQAKLLPGKEKKLAKLEEDLLVSTVNLEELQTLKAGAMDLGKARTGISVLAGLVGGSELIDISRVEKKVADMKTAWRGRGFYERSVTDLGDTLRRALELHCREKGLSFLAEIGRQIDVRKEAHLNLESQIKGLRQEIEHIRGEEAILGLMHKHSANMFIIRGFKGSKPDEPDDLERLYRAVSAENSEIPRDQFLFDPNNRAFDAVKYWIEGFSSQFTPKLQQMIHLQHDITLRLKTAIDDARAFITQTKQEILSEVKGDSDNAIAKNLKLQIDRATKELLVLDQKQIQLGEENQQFVQESNGIMTAPARDFRSELQLDKPGWSWFTFGWSWLYEFRRLNAIESLVAAVGKRVAPDIPIERVELSCVQDAQKRVVFKTPIEKQFVDDNLFDNATWDASMQFEQRAHNVDVVKSGPGSHLYGRFDVKKNDLEQGNLAVKYYSDEERKGRCAVRVFVLPRHLPAERGRIRELSAKLERNYSAIEAIASQASKKSKVIANDTEYLELLKAGNRNQGTKILRIVELLSRLGAYSEQEVIELFGLDEVFLPSFQWLKNPANFELAQSILRFKGHQFPDAYLGVDVRTLVAVMGVNFALRVAAVDGKEEANNLGAQMKPGEALLYKERNTNKIRILYNHKAGQELVKEFIQVTHPSYSALDSFILKEGENVSDKNVIRIVYDVLQETISESKSILYVSEADNRAKLARFPENFFFYMLVVSQTTGFTVASIHKILDGLKPLDELKEAALHVYNKLEREKALGEFFFTKLRSLYHANETQFSTIREIIELLNCGNQRVVATFLQCYQELRSKDLSQISYSVSEDLTTYVESEVVRKKDYFQEKYNFSDEEWAQVVTGFKLRTTMWIGRYPNSQITFESLGEPTLTGVAIIGLLGNHARDLLAVAADDSCRAALASECLAFLKHEHRLPIGLSAKWDHLRQNARAFETQAKSLLAELGLESKFVNLHYFATDEFKTAVKNSAKGLEFSQVMRDHFAAVSELEGALKGLSRSREAFAEYCESLVGAKQVGPHTLAKVAALSKKSVVIWEEHLSNPRMLNLVVSSDNQRNNETMHLLLLPPGPGTVYKYAFLFHVDESVGPAEAVEEEKKYDALEDNSREVAVRPQPEDEGLLGEPLAGAQPRRASAPPPPPAEAARRASAPPPPANVQIELPA